MLLQLLACYWVLFLAPFAATADATTTTITPEPTPSTIVDVLSSQAQFSYFLRHLQVNGLIPLLNTLENVTVLAPINSAFTELRNAAGGDFFDDNLLRYIINQRFRVGYLDTTTTVYDTLLQLDRTNYTLAVSPDFTTLEYVVDNVSAIVDPDIYAKHQYSFIQGIEKLLPLKSTLCDVLTGYETINGHKIEFVQTLFRQLFATENGFPKSCEEFLQGTKTIFIPSDETVEKDLSPLYLKYLTRPLDPQVVHIDAIKETRNDIIDLLSSIMLPDLVIGRNGTSTGRKAYAIHHSLNKARYNVTLSETNEIVLNNVVSHSTHEVFADGVIHVFQPNQKSFFKYLSIKIHDMIPRKALYALGYSNFVNELKFRKLHHLIDGSKGNQTIFVSKEQDDSSQDELLAKNYIHIDSFSATQSLMYQFTEGFIDINTLDHPAHTLLTSKLCSKKRIGSCYKIKLATSGHNSKLTKATINDGVDLISKEGIDAGNHTMIYLTHQELQTPPSLKHALGDIISNTFTPAPDDIEVDKDSCLRTLGYLSDFGLYSLEDNDKGFSVFLPCAKKAPKDQKTFSKAAEFGAWSELGLVLQYFENHPKLFKDIMKGMFVEDTLYSDFGCFENTTMTSKSMRGDFVHFEGHRCSGSSRKHIVNFNHTAISIPLNSDILFNQGVIHLTDKVLIPESFEIPFVDLLKTTIDKNYPEWSIVDLIEKIPTLRKYLLDEVEHKKKYSLLVPSAEALKSFNITSLWEDLDRFFQLHLIPNSEVGKLLSCIGSNVYTYGQDQPSNGTNSGFIYPNITEASLTCSRNEKNGKIYLRLNNQEQQINELGYNRDHEVRVLSHGCTNFDFKEEDEMCVFLIDKPLNLEWLKDKHNDNFLHIHLGFISLGIGIILGLIMFGGLLLTLLLCLGRGSSDGKKPSSADNRHPFVIPDPASSFMRVTSDEESSVAYDRGYETDVDVLRESDYLLNGTKRYTRRGYGATRANMASNENRSAPRTIKGPNPAKGLNRERNIPACM